MIALCVHCKFPIEYHQAETSICPDGNPFSHKNIKNRKWLKTTFEIKKQQEKETENEKEI